MPLLSACDPVWFPYSLSKARVDASVSRTVCNPVLSIFFFHVVNSTLPLSLESFSAGVSMTFRVIQKCTLGRNFVEECRMSLIGVFFVLVLPPVSGTMLNAPVSPAREGLVLSEARLTQLVNFVSFYAPYMAR